MSHSPGLVLLVLDISVLMYVVLQPLGRRFDDSDRGAGTVVKLPPFQRPSLPRDLAVLALVLVSNVVIVAFRTSPFVQLYRALVARLLDTVVNDPAFATYYAAKLVPLVPTTVLAFMVIAALVLPATPGRRLMIAARACCSWRCRS